MRTSANIRFIWFCVLAIAAAAGHAQSEGSSCSLQKPPPDAGENAVHAKILKIHPRAKNIPSGFSGCQSVWLEAPPNWAIAFRLYFKGGRVVRLWTPEYECYYSGGKLKKPSSSECGAEVPEPMRSEPAGCVSQHRDASRPIEECVGDEPAG